MRANNSLKPQDYGLMLGICLLAIARVIATQSIGCPEYFDCNSYIQMTYDLSPRSDIPGHHAMRILPVIFVRALMWFGLNIELAFEILSGACYAGFGVATYWFIRRFTQDKLYAISGSLLLLALHEAMRIPLYLVYQSNDALVYPIGLAILIAAYDNKVIWTFVFALLGALTRQNLFVLGFLSLIYLAKKHRNFHAGIFAAILTVTYFLHQNHFQAHGVFADLLNPPGGFFSLQGQWRILIESQFLELWISLIPFILISFKPVIAFFKDHWHWLIYAAITIGQPYVGFHMTGNNFPRLALQGVWVIALALFICSPLKNAPRIHQIMLLLYAIAMYATWGVSQRLWIVAGFSLIYASSIYFKRHIGRIA